MSENLINFQKSIRFTA